ncbi:MAG: hypothetical protein AB1641_12355 [Thermodesulfobacteriota bacterium]
MIVEVQPIPLAVDPVALAGRAGLSLAEAEAALAQARRQLSPAACFEELRPEELLPPELVALRPWGETILAGLCSLGPDSGSPPADLPASLWAEITRLALRGVLDFLEYRLKLFLKPTGRQPGPRLVPGCPELPLEVNAAILRLLGPEHSLRLTLNGRGGFDGGFGLAFVYPTLAWSAQAAGPCAACTRQDCPARI